MEMKNNELDERVLEIDEFHLDKEWVEQPRKYYVCARHLATAEKRYNERKANLALVEAEVAAKIRANPKKYIKGEFARGSPSDTAIKAAVLQDSEYQTALRRFHKASENVDVMKALVVAMDHRKKALENAVLLWMYSYSASPKLKGEIPREKEDEMRNEATKRKVRETNRKMRK